MIFKEKKLRKILMMSIYFTIILIIAKFIIYKINGSLVISSLFINSFFNFINFFIFLIIYEYLLKNKTKKYKYEFYRITNTTTIPVSFIVLLTVFFIYKQTIIYILYKYISNYDSSNVFIMFLLTIIFLIINYLNIIFKKLKLLISKEKITRYKINNYIVIKGFGKTFNNISLKKLGNSIKNKIIYILKNKNNIFGYNNFKEKKPDERIFKQIYIEINKYITLKKVHKTVESLKTLIKSIIKNLEVLIYVC